MTANLLIISTGDGGGKFSRDPPGVRDVMEQHAFQQLMVPAELREQCMTSEHMVSEPASRAQWDCVRIHEELTRYSAAS